MLAVRHLSVAAVSCVLVVAAATYAPRAALGKSPPAVTSVSTHGDSNRGDVLVTLLGTKLTTFRTISLDNLTGGGQVTITVLAQAKDRIVVRIPPDLAAGSYQFSLAPRSGTPTQVAYSVPTVARVGGFDVTTGNVATTNTITADRTTNTFSIGTAFAPGAGVGLTGVVTGKAGMAPQFRFARTAPGNDFVDIGMNSVGSFTVENRFDTELFAVDQSGSVRVGVQNGSTRFSVNGPVVGGYTAQINGHPSDNGYLAITDGAADIFSVESTGITLFVGNAVKPGGGAWGTASDARLKKDVAPLAGALDSLLGLRSVTFEYIDPAKIHEAAGRHVGFIAQEVEKVLPGWVGEGKDGMKFVAPKGFEALTVGALRELRAEKDAQIRSLAEENAALRARLAEIEARSSTQDARLAAIERALAGVASSADGDAGVASSPR